MARRLYKLILLSMASLFSPFLLLAQKDIQGKNAEADSIPLSFTSPHDSEIGIREDAHKINPRFAEIRETTTVTTVMEDGTVITESYVGSPQEPVVVPPGEEKKKGYSPVTLGLELGTSLDISGLDQSTFNADILIGFRNTFIQFLGISAGVHKSLGTRDNFIPIYAVFRSSFTKRPALCFFTANAGYGFNTISHSPVFGDITASLGCGVNLKRTPKFQSNIILGFGFRHFNDRHRTMVNTNKSNIGFAQISLGVSM